MEQDEQDLNIYDFRYKNYFQIDFKGQKVENKIEFKKWYESAKKYIKSENKRRSDSYIRNQNIQKEYISILTIEFCHKCLSYTICSLSNKLSYIKCNKCFEDFCIGCSKKRLLNNNSDPNFLDDTLCLKGYLKTLYLRIINRRSLLTRTSPAFHIMHIFFCLFFTPLYLGFISNFMGTILIHSNKANKTNLKNCSRSVFELWCYFIYSLLRGLLMFPYMILFFPFMFILLLPSIFSYKYYLYVFVSYVAAIFPEEYPLINVGEK